MSMTLDGLLRAIHPDVTINRFEQEANAAILRTPRIEQVPRDARSLLLVLSALTHRLNTPVSGAFIPFPVVHFNRYARVVDARLRQHFSPRGIGAAFQIVRARGASGLRELMQLLIDSHARERTNLVVSRRVDAFWREQDALGRIEAAKLYLRRFHQFLPADQRYRDPVRLATVLPQVLKQHPYRLRDLMKSDALNGYSA